MQSVATPETTFGQLWPPGAAQSLGLVTTGSSVGPNTPSGKALAFHGMCKALCTAHRLEAVLSAPLPTGPKILVALHQNYVDPVVICGATPCTPIAKFDVRAWPVLGRIAERYNTLFVKQGDAHSGARALIRMVRLLEAGASVLAFPEGTSTIPRCGSLQRGAFGVARLLNVPVIPLALQFEGPPKFWVGHDGVEPQYLTSWSLQPRRVRIEVGPSLWSVDFPTSGAHATAAQTWLSSRVEPEDERLKAG